MQFSAETSRVVLHALDPQTECAPRTRCLAHHLRHRSGYTPTRSAPVAATTAEAAARFLQLVYYAGDLPLAPAADRLRIPPRARRDSAVDLLKKNRVRTVEIGNSPDMRVRARAHASSAGPGAVWEFVGCADELAISDDAWDAAVQAGIVGEDLLLACQLAIIETLSDEEGASAESTAACLLGKLSHTSLRMQMVNAVALSTRACVWYTPLLRVECALRPSRRVYIWTGDLIHVVTLGVRTLTVGAAQLACCSVLGTRTEKRPRVADAGRAAVIEALMEGAIIECSREAVRRELDQSDREIPSGLEGPLLFVSMPPRWRETSLTTDDKHCALAYEFRFVEGVGVEVRRSPPLLLQEALDLLRAHCRRA